MAAARRVDVAHDQVQYLLPRKVYNLILVLLKDGIDVTAANALAQTSALVAQEGATIHATIHVANATLCVCKLIDWKLDQRIVLPRCHRLRRHPLLCLPLDLSLRLSLDLSLVRAHFVIGIVSFRVFINHTTPTALALCPLVASWWVAHIARNPLLCARSVCRAEIVVAFVLGGGAVAVWAERIHNEAVARRGAADAGLEHGVDGVVHLHRLCPRVLVWLVWCSGK